MSRFASKANFWKHLGQCSWEDLVFRDRCHLERQEANIALLTNCSLLLKNFWVKRFVFFLPVNFVVFQQRSKDMLQQALVWLLHWKHKNSRMQSASLYFPLGSLFPKSSCAYSLRVGVRVPTSTWRELQLHHGIWSAHFPPGGANGRISAMLVNTCVCI